MLAERDAKIRELEETVRMLKEKLSATEKPAELKKIAEVEGEKSHKVDIQYENVEVEMEQRNMEDIIEETALEQEDENS